MLQRGERTKQLLQDLTQYGVGKRRPFLPFRDYSVRIEDMIPAFSGVIGKISLVAAFAMAWMLALGIKDPGFVTENVRLELIVGGVLTIFFTTLLSLRAVPPGTLAPLIPLIPAMAASGVRPLPLALLIGGAGLLLSRLRCFGRLAKLNGVGTKAGMMLLFGWMGLLGSLEKLRTWTDQSVPQGSILFALLLVGGGAMYMLTAIIKKRWLMIPLAAILAVTLSFFYGSTPVLQTLPGLPILDPVLWWEARWGVGMGLDPQSFIAAIPYALLILFLWPTDAIAVQLLQEKNYPERSEAALLDLDDTFTAVSIRNIIGVFLGGAQTAAVWRSFMIPLAVIRRPIAGASLLLAILAILCGLLGFPIDIAIFPPLVWLVLILGVFFPLLETSLRLLRRPGIIITALFCVTLGVLVHPIVGWSLSMIAENLIAKSTDPIRSTLSRKEKIVTVAVASVGILTFILAI